MNPIDIEETEDGLDFKGGKVKVSADDTAGYLPDKLTSENESITIGNSSGETTAVNLEIDPSYFYSEDESIDIEETEDGLNFEGGKVKVSADDTAGYLPCSREKGSMDSLFVKISKSYGISVIFFNYDLIFFNYVT